jgi:hypothetical protein
MEDEEVDDSENLSEVESDDGTEASVLGDKTSSTDINDIESEVEEDTGAASKPLTLIDKLKSKIVALKKSPATANETEPGEKTGVVKKKGINPVILVIVVLGLGSLWFFEDETPEEAVPEAPSSFKRPVRKKPVKAEEPKVEEPKVEEPKVEEPKAEEPKAEEPKEEEPKAEEPKEEEPKAEEPKAEEAKEEEPKAEEPKAEEAKEEEPKVEEPATSPETETPAVEEPKVDAPTASEDTIGAGTDDANDGTITDKILEDLEQQVQKEKPKETVKEYVSPPDYEYRGRGLVYNCAGKHWACVDAPSYKMCENNFSSVNYLKKKVECYPANIYETTKGCEQMQNRNVSSGQKTEFCSGN